MFTTITLKETTCFSCGVRFAMQNNFYDMRLRDGYTFYCPAGHGQIFTARRDGLDKLKREKQALQSQLSWAATEAEEAKRQRREARTKLTKFKNRVANGVCPCCHRTFKQLAAHMTNKHPDFKEAVG